MKCSRCGNNMKYGDIGIGYLVFYCDCRNTVLSTGWNEYIPAPSFAGLLSDDDFDDSDEATEHDIRWFDLMLDAGLIPGIADKETRARADRMAKRLKLRIMEWSGSREKPYFVAEYVNGMDE